MSCSRDPPSDQDWYTFEPWGEGASSPRLEPWIATRVNGAAPMKVPTESCSPDGTLRNCRLTVSGWISTVWVCGRPPESVAVRMSSR